MRRALRMLLWIVAALALAFVAFAVYIRAAPDDAARWHRDPETAEERGKDNDFIVSPSGEGVDMASPLFDKSPAELMTRFQRVALAAPNTTLLGERDGFATFIQRTKVMAFPDYISVKAVEAEGGSKLYVYSRSRYGRSDFGVNKARVLSWLDKL